VLDMILQSCFNLRRRKLDKRLKKGKGRDGKGSNINKNQAFITNPFNFVIFPKGRCNPINIGFIETLVFDVLGKAEMLHQAYEGEG